MDNRSKEQIRQHYEIEKELAKKLLNAPRQERSRLAAPLYDDLYRRVTHHPQHTKKNSPSSVQDAVNVQLQFLQPFLKSCRTFLEIWPCYCALSLKVSNTLKQVYAVDVSSEITRMNLGPKNFKLILTDGRNIPLEINSIDITYSNQLIASSASRSCYRTA